MTTRFFARSSITRAAQCNALCLQQCPVLTSTTKANENCNDATFEKCTMLHCSDKLACICNYKKLVPSCLIAKVPVQQCFLLGSNLTACHCMLLHDRHIHFVHNWKLEHTTFSQFSLWKKVQNFHYNFLSSIAVLFSLCITRHFNFSNAQFSIEKKSMLHLLASPNVISVCASLSCRTCLVSQKQT